MATRFYPKSVITKMNGVKSGLPPWGGSASSANVVRNNIYPTGTYVGPVLDMMTGIERSVVDHQQVIYFPDHIFTCNAVHSTSSEANRTFRIYDRHTLELLHTVVVGTGGGKTRLARIGPTTLFLRINTTVNSYLLQANGTVVALGGLGPSMGATVFGEEVYAGAAVGLPVGSAFNLVTATGYEQMRINRGLEHLEPLVPSTPETTFLPTPLRFACVDGSLFMPIRETSTGGFSRLCRYPFAAGTTVTTDDFDVSSSLGFERSTPQSVMYWAGVGIVSVSESHGVTAHSRDDLSLIGTLLGPGSIHTMANTIVSQCGANLCIICNTNAANEAKRIAYLYDHDLNLLWQRPVRELACLPTGTIGNFGVIGNDQRLYVSDGATRSAVIDVETSDPVYVYTDRGGRFNDTYARLSQLDGCIEFPQRLGRRIRHLPEDVHPNT